MVQIVPGLHTHFAEAMHMLWPLDGDQADAWPATIRVIASSRPLTSSIIASASPASVAHRLQPALSGPLLTLAPTRGLRWNLYVGAGVRQSCGRLMAAKVLLRNGRRSDKLRASAGDRVRREPLRCAAATVTVIQSPCVRLRPGPVLKLPCCGHSFSLAKQEFSQRPMHVLAPRASAHSHSSAAE